MDAKEVRELMSRLGEGVGQEGVALRCSCENLETVSVVVDENGDVRVTDDHRTFQYLDRGADSAYVPVQSLDMADACHICEELRVELKPAPQDGYPSIECVVDLGQHISEAVERVAQAVDRIFDLATQRDPE